jgi:hypothetical protein
VNIELTGISPEIDNCSSLIRSRAAATHRRIPEQHKRWIDPEDVLQDSLIAALQAATTWDAANKAKFSTYLYTGLHFSHDKAYHAPLKQQKRSTKLLELDAPVSASLGKEGGVLADLLGVEDATPTSARESVESFVAICSEVSGPAALLFIKGLLCNLWSEQGRRAVDEAKLLAEIKDAADCLGIDMEQMSLLHKDEKTRRAALTAVSGTIRIGLGTEVVDARILECVDCKGKLLLSDIKAGKYIVATMTCKPCYEKLAKAPLAQSCFGKMYDPEVLECKEHCADSIVCKDFTPIEEKKMEEDFDLDGIDFSDIETPVEEVPSLAAATEPLDEVKPAEKPAKEPKAPKAPKEAKVVAAVPDLGDIGPRYPFKANSAVQAAWKLCYDGIPAVELEKLITSKGNNFAVTLFMLRVGQAGTKRPTHTWKFDESGGVYKITDVKYIGK